MEVVPLALQDPQVVLGDKVLQVLKDKTARMVWMDLLVMTVALANLVEATMAQEVTPVTMDLKALRVTLVRKVREDLQESAAPKEKIK
jgi:hypothetical protein